MSMRKVIFAIVIVLLGCSVTCFGKKLVDPDTLTFKKTYSFPDMSKDELYQYTAGWPYKQLNLEFGGVRGGYGNKGFRGRYFDVLFGKTRGDLFGDVILVFRDGSFDLVFKNISAQWRNNYVTCMSTNDDKFNRTWFWRASRSKKILNNVRLRSSEIFEMITASMDHYLEVGPPVELKKI